MNRDGILTVLKSAEPDLKARGVAHAAVFGSRARGDFDIDSDIDVLVDLQADRHIDVFGYVEVVQYIEGLFPVPVDVANRAALKDAVRPTIERDAIYAF